MRARGAALRGEEERDVAGALSRAGVYRVLGGAFAYPTNAGFEELGRLGERAAVAPGLMPGLADPLRAFARAARAAQPAAVAEESVFLFDRAARCPPYEGAYGDAPQMAGKAAQLADIAGFYTAFGLAPAAARPDAEDHIAAELEFMSALAIKEAHARVAGAREGLDVTRAAQRSFLRDHLGRWAEPFAAALRDATPLPYYAALADLLTACVRADVARTHAAPAVLDGRLPADPIQADAFTCPMAADPGPPVPDGPAPAA